MLEFIQTQKAYGDHLVLSIPSLRLEKGVYWLQGANGSGKTTLLRMAAGLLPFQGDIRVDGCSLRRDPVGYRRSISWSDAEPLYPGFITGEEIISFYQDIRHPFPGQVGELVTRFGMQSYLSSPLGGWSSGMTKKLALLLALMGRPSWVLLDEPLVTLDREAIPELYALILEMGRRQGVGFLLSSHQDIDAGGILSPQKLHTKGQTIYLAG
jgi:ABC-2 type transport system ATP-binding protein